MKTREHFDPLMGHLRGYHPLSDARVQEHRDAVQMRIELVPYFMAKAGVRVA
jgi:hypothetical protein